MTDDLTALVERPGLMLKERAVLALAIALLDGPAQPVSMEEYRQLPCKILVELIDGELNLKLR